MRSPEPTEGWRVHTEFLHRQLLETGRAEGRAERSEEDFSKGYDVGLIDGVWFAIVIAICFAAVVGLAMGAII